MNNLYIMWLYALRFVTCKVGVHLYFVQLLLNGIGNLLAYVAFSFVSSVCQWICVRG